MSEGRRFSWSNLGCLLAAIGFCTVFWAAIIMAALSGVERLLH